jgi:hypothetical protein
MKNLAAKLAAGARWAVSPEGRKDLGALLGTLAAIYEALHRAGI